MTVSRRAAGGPEVGRHCFAQCWRSSTNVEACDGEGQEKNRNCGVAGCLHKWTALDQARSKADPVVARTRQWASIMGLNKTRYVPD